MSIHPTAVIKKGAELGVNVSVGPFAYIAADTQIGDNSEIAPHTVIHQYTTLGSGCRVHAGAVLGDLPQDIAFGGEKSEVRVGDNCILREGVTIHRGTKPDTATVVGNDCFLMAFSHLAHNVVLGDGVIMANGALLAGYVEVGARAFISGNAVVHQFTRIGRLAMISGLAGVGKDVPPFCTVQGVRRNEVGGLNVVGMRRAGMSPDERKQVKAAFAVLYRSGLNFSEAIERMKAEFRDGPAAEIWQFCEGSKRGVCPLTGSDDAGD